MKSISLFKALFGAVLSCLMLVGAANAADKGTGAEAEAIVKRAIDYIKVNGSDKANEEFTNGRSFKDRDLYIFVYDLTGKNLAHGANPKLVGKNLIGLKDSDGKEVIKMVLDLAKVKGKGWTENIKFMNPVTQQIENKALYIERNGDTLVGCGIYKS